MLRLKPAKDFDIDLGDGAVLHLRAVALADRTAAFIALAGALKGETAPKDGAESLLFMRYVLAAELLKRCLTSWDGVGDEAGQPVPIGPEWIGRLLLVPGVYDRIEDELVLPLLVRLAEKNGSSPLPNGTSAGAPKAEAGTAAGEDIAASARNDAKPVLMN